MNNLSETLEACRRMGFGPEITAETCWNEGYRLGRQRWHWGPWWFVNFVGWTNTQKQKLLKAFKKNEIGGKALRGESYTGASVAPTLSLPTCDKVGNHSDSAGEPGLIEPKSP